MIFADALLARRIEAAEAAIARGTSGQPGSAVLEAGGGCAIFAGADSPLTHAVGIGPERSRQRGARSTRSSRFFRSRGAKVSFDVCPLADPASDREPRRARLPGRRVQ